jgi:predicted RNase H-related nuclease YkuK (DUF458 family)
MRTKWRTLNGEHIDDIVQWTDTQVGEVVHVGTDSLQTGRFTQFVTVVVILNPPHGGRVAYVREVVDRITSLRERLNKEVWMSVELSLQFARRPVVHIDANPKERFMSSKYIQELVGMVVGQGFEYLAKPDAWAATHAADHVVRHKGFLPKGVNRRAPRAAGKRRVS